MDDGKEGLETVTVAKVHFVCTGNICRSPFAQAYMEKQFEGLVNFEFTSSGLFVLEERPVSQGIKSYIEADAGNRNFKHLSQQTNSSLLAQQDLILVMTREHRLAVLEECPAAISRVFTLLEFPRLLSLIEAEGVALPAEATKAESIRSAARTLSQHRSLLKELESEAVAEDVIDPYRLKDEVYREAVGQMVPALAALADFLRRFR